MRDPSQVKPIHLGEKREPVVIIQNGEAKAVSQDIATFEQTQEMLALLKLLALGKLDAEERNTEPARAVIERLRSRAADRR